MIKFSLEVFTLNQLHMIVLILFSFLKFLTKQKTGFNSLPTQITRYILFSYRLFNKEMFGFFIQEISETPIEIARSHGNHMLTILFDSCMLTEFQWLLWQVMVLVEKLPLLLLAITKIK